MKCWRGQSPQIMGLHNSIIETHNSIMELHNSIYGASLQIMQLYMNYGLHHHLQKSMNHYALKLNYIELHNLMCMGWVGLFLSWLHT